MNKRSESQWRGLFEAHEASGQSAAAFCRERGLCPKYFSLRRRQLQGEGVKAKAPNSQGAFVPVRLSASAALTLQVGDAVLRLPATVSPAWVAQLLGALRA